MTADGADAPAIHGVTFAGKGAEYFRIWIVNLALSVLTLGIYSAWAKVRARRYFYGSTLLDGHPFEYHAQPWRILLGRAIVFAFVLAAAVSTYLLPLSGALWIAAALAALPTLVNRAVRFDACNTSWRNVRFHFNASYRQALVANVIAPAAALALLPAPLTRRSRETFYVNHLRFGGHAFKTEIGAGRIIAIYMFGFILLGVLVVAIIAGLMTLAEIETHMPGWLRAIDVSFLSDNLQPIGLGLIGLGVVLIAALVATLSKNLAIGGTTLDGGFRLRSRVSAIRVAWIVASNAVLTLATLGLYYPFGRIRLARYRMGQYDVIADRDIDAFTAQALDEQSAIGREVAGRFDLGFGL